MLSAAATAVDHLRQKGRPAPALYSVATLRELAPDFLRNLASGYNQLYVVEETVDAGGLLDEVTTGFARLVTTGILAAPPPVRHRAVSGMTFSTRDPGGLYEYFRLSANELEQLFRSE